MMLIHLLKQPQSYILLHSLNIYTFLLINIPIYSKFCFKAAHLSKDYQVQAAMTGHYNREFWFLLYLAVCHSWRWQKSCRSCTAPNGGGGRSRLGGAYKTESHCCLGSHPALTAPTRQISFTQQIPLSCGKHKDSRRLKAIQPCVCLKTSTVPMLIID